MLLPLHPRTRKKLAAADIAPAAPIRIIDPLPYGALISLASNAAAIATDSGGLQKEAYFAGVPCVTLRDETEWVESLADGWNRLAVLTPAGIAEAISILVSLRCIRHHRAVVKIATHCICVHVVVRVKWTWIARVA